MTTSRSDHGRVVGSRLKKDDHDAWMAARKFARPRDIIMRGVRAILRGEREPEPRAKGPHDGDTPF